MNLGGGFLENRICFDCVLLTDFESEASGNFVCGTHGNFENVDWGMCENYYVALGYGTHKSCEISGGFGRFDWGIFEYFGC